MNTTTMNTTTKTHDSPGASKPDAPLSKKAPGSPFVVVALSYLGILLVATLAFAMLFWMFG